MTRALIREFGHTVPHEENLGPVLRAGLWNIERGLMEICVYTEIHPK